MRMNGKEGIKKGIKERKARWKKLINEKGGEEIWRNWGGGRK